MCVCVFFFFAGNYLLCFDSRRMEETIKNVQQVPRKVSTNCICCMSLGSPLEAVFVHGILIITGRSSGSILLAWRSKRSIHRLHITSLTSSSVLVLLQRLLVYDVLCKDQDVAIYMHVRAKLITRVCMWCVLC